MYLCALSLVCFTYYRRNHYIRVLMSLSSNTIHSRYMYYIILTSRLIMMHLMHVTEHRKFSARFVQEPKKPNMLTHEENCLLFNLHVGNFYNLFSTKSIYNCLFEHVKLVLMFNPHLTQFVTNVLHYHNL